LGLGNRVLGKILVLNVLLVLKLYSGLDNVMAPLLAWDS
jgi:hypothetical protein